MTNWFEVVCALLLMLTSWKSLVWMSRRRKLPPGPFPLPIVGNLLQLGRRPHHSLTQLSKKYGPLMSIHLGSKYTLVVSSPEMAKEILQKHGQVYSGRPDSQAAGACDHSNLSIGFLPVAGSIWRDLRKICNEHMFSHECLEATRGLRRHNFRQLLGHVQKCCDSGRAVNIREAVFITMVNLISSTLYSAEAADFDSEANTGDLKESVEDVIRTLGLANLADLFPILKGFDLQGLKYKTGVSYRRLLDKMEGYLNERVGLKMSAPESPKRVDFLERLVDIMENADEYRHVSREHVTHLMMDLLVGGSETSTITTEWVMSTLMLNPDKMGKATDEVRRVVGRDRKIVEESDVDKLQYLQAVIKEVLRYNPPAPLLAPRKVESDHEVHGYHIPKGAWVFINVWGMARDSNIWESPDSIDPERFLRRNNKDINYKGHDYQLIPFGSGRRVCPGLALATRIVHVTVATLLHNFNWELEKGATAADHRDEMVGFSMQRSVPLKIIPIGSM